MEAMIKQFIAGMSKEEKQKIIQEFMSSMSDEEKMEMMEIIMPIIMKDMPALMANMMKDFDKNDCRKMIKEMSPEIREKCKEMMMFLAEPE